MLIYKCRKKLHCVEHSMKQTNFIVPVVILHHTQIQINMRQNYKYYTVS